MAPVFPVGRLVDRPDETAVLRPERFNRHTFWCGQSGSGKTYALGVVLERLLLHTRLPVLVLDPNADFVRIDDVLDTTDDGEATALRAVDVHVLRPPGSEGERLHVRFVDLDLRAKAAVLQLDPVADPDEFNVLLHVLRDYGPQTMAEMLPTLRESQDVARRRLAVRIENLGVIDWDVWAWGGESATDVIDRRPGVTVLDLSGFTRPEEPQVAALAVLDHLWATRQQRRPVLVVVDEAHNLCPADPIGPVERALTERVVQIAAEGRKYGLWLLLSTQRPGKIHPNALSQCDNLALMKMSSPRDLAELADVFGYAPPELLQRSPRFTQGQALLAGGFVGEPTVVQVASRLTREGGSDVPVPLA